MVPRSQTFSCGSNTPPISMKQPPLQSLLLRRVDRGENGQPSSADTGLEKKTATRSSFHIALETSIINLLELTVYKEGSLVNEE